MMETILFEGIGKEVEPFAPSLPKTIETAAELNNERVPVSIVLREARGHAHVEIFMQWGLEVRLTDVCRGQVVVASRGESKD